ncbi:PIR Superfamily Protein, partial [Plasmodium ovale curtisi]
LKNVPNAQNLDNAGLSSAESPQSDELNSIPKRELPCKEMECSIGGSSQCISEKDESLQYDTNSAVHKTFNDPDEVTTRTRDTATNEDSDIGGTTVLYDGKGSPTIETKPTINSLKMYITIGLSILGFLLLLIPLFKFSPLGSRFSKKKKKKRQEIQEELERMIYSPSNFNENNMYLSYAHLED